MTTSSSFRVLIASDGSPSANAALATAAAFPWPSGNRAQGVVVRAGAFLPPHADAWALSGDATQRVAAAARRKLAARWKDAQVPVSDGDPVDAIFEEARKVRAQVIVVGWRGHGRFRRLLVGSVSRGVLRRASVPVLVVRHAAGAIQRVVIGLDGSPEAARGVRFLARCKAPKGASVTLVTVVTPFVASSHVLLSPAFSGQIRADVAAHNAKERGLATERIEKAASQLADSGWRVRSLVREGAPLYELLRVVTEAGADLLVVGVRGRSALAMSTLGSVTEGVLTRCRAPVLVVP
ncbi:MAG: Universal stress protein family [Chloroflexi bacterium]|nr:Universal stress protein family [Chloroflexota bacterium]